MKKVVLPVLITMLFIAHTSASECIHLKGNLVRYQRSSVILQVQNFLFKKGFLTTTPNGYFGTGTFTAVKAYQSSIGINQTGTIGPATRLQIENETCGNGVASSTQVVLPIKEVSSKIATTTRNSATSSAISIPLIPQAGVLSNLEINTILHGGTSTADNIALHNATRKSDLEKILQALYEYFVDSRGVLLGNASSSPSELCASVSDSDCFGLASISKVVPAYLSEIPRDPNLSTSSSFSGYMMSKIGANEVVLTNKYKEGTSFVTANCNFNTFCTMTGSSSDVQVSKPSILSINRTVLVRDAVAENPLIISGDNLAGSTTLIVFALATSQKFVLGSVYSNDGKTIRVDSSYFNKAISCGDNCFQKLPVGDYSVSLRNAIGESNKSYVSLRGFSAVGIDSFMPNATSTKGVKIATITLRSSVSGPLKSLSLVSLSTTTPIDPRSLFLKDQSTGVRYESSALTFSLQGESLQENKTKVYDLYADILPVSGYTSPVYYSGNFVMTDSFQGVTLKLPFKEFPVSIPHP